MYSIIYSSKRMITLLLLSIPPYFKLQYVSDEVRLLKKMWITFYTIEGKYWAYMFDRCWPLEISICIEPNSLYNTAVCIEQQIRSECLAAQWQSKSIWLLMYGKIKMGFTSLL